LKTSLATDPLSDLPVAFALVASNDQAHMRRFLGNLRTWELEPKVVVTDGLNLYPAVLAELWPEADHQLCVFHVIKDINKLILDAVRRMRTAMGRRGKAGRKKKRGRKGAKSKAAAARRGMTVEEKANFVFKRRYLIVKRRENLTESERDDLIRMLEYLPELATLRRFADRIYWLFDTPKDAQQAGCRRAVIVRDQSFQAVPELAKAMEQLNEEKFTKLTAYLKNPIRRRVRTNNHVERTNRMFRLLEKVRYKWRRRRTLVRFVVVTLDAIWRDWTPAEAKSAQLSKPVRQGTMQVHDGQRSRQVA
jgi:transposase-like protein